VVYLHPDFIWNTPLAPTIGQHDFWDYSLKEALFLSAREEATILTIIAAMSQELATTIDRFSKPIIVSHVANLLSYADRYYHRQFITREKANHEVLARLETLLQAYFDSENLPERGLPTVQYVADCLHLSPKYLSNLLRVVTGQNTQQHIYPMRRRFTSYKAYADATMTDIFPGEELAKASKLEATELRTMLFLNNKGKFTPAELPMEAQFSAVSQVASGDYNHDGHPDLLLLGNHTDNRLKMGSLDAGYGCLLQGDGTGRFRYVPQPAAGVCVVGDVKSVSEITVDRQPYLVVGVSGSPVQFYKE
jgi:AraC-like DNA-binding protein